MRNFLSKNITKNSSDQDDDKDEENYCKILKMYFSIEFCCEIYLTEDLQLKAYI